MLRIIGRMLLVPLGLLIAAIVAIVVLFTLGPERLLQEIHAQGPIDSDAVDTIWNMLRQAQFIGGLAASLTIVPGVLLVIVGEVAAIRSAIYYVLGGGAALAGLPLIGQVMQASEATLPSATLLQIFATAGFAAGFVYWLIAGRSAGWSEPDLE